MTQTETSLATREPQDNPPIGGKAAKEQGLASIDSGEFANLLDRSRFEQIYSVSQLFAKSQMVPQHYQGKVENCFIGVQMAIRLGVDPFMFLQNTYIVHGRPGMEAKLSIALINSSGLFVDSLDYEIEGEDPTDQNYRVRAFATRKSSGKVVHGPWIDWSLVRGEGWDKTNGSKWKTMPGLMFQYRAGTFFGRLHCPERLMGMQTVDEIDDVGPPRFVASQARGAEGLAERLGAKPADEAIDDLRPSTEEQPQQHPSDEPEQAAATEPAPAEDPKPKQTSKGGKRSQPTAHEQIVIRFAEKHELELVDARALLDAHCRDHMDAASLDELSIGKLNELQQAIKNGDVSLNA